MIDETEGMASSSVYSNRFGGLVRAYGLVGFNPGRDYAQRNRLTRLYIVLHRKFLSKRERAASSRPIQ
jgi:hypothetical protein